MAYGVYSCGLPFVGRYPFE